MRWKILSEGVRKSPSEDVAKNLVFHVNRCKNIFKKDLQLHRNKIQIKHKLTSADMEFLVIVINHYHIDGFASILRHLVLEQNLNSLLKNQTVFSK